MTIEYPRPIPEGETRQTAAKNRRDKATELSVSRVNPPVTSSNGEEKRYEGIWPSNFTKGLPHTADGVVDARAYELFVNAINQPDGNFDVPLGPRSIDNSAGRRPSHRPEGYEENPDSVETFYCQRFTDPNGTKHYAGLRRWESPLAGHVYDLEGPDADNAAMERAPTLGCSELSAEMAEVYAMALLRDVPFTQIENGTGNSSLGASVNSIVEGLNSLPWFDPEGRPVTAFPDYGDNSHTLTVQETRRRLARTHEPLEAANTELRPLSSADLFRGSVPGAKQGPFISQFMLLGSEGRNGHGYSSGSCWPAEPQTKHNAEDGFIIYGAQAIDQRVYPQTTDLDYMTSWPSWLDVQNGADLVNATRFESQRRFITTPRDLASYVHYDALYQAYLNACLILLNQGAQFQLGFPDGNDTRTRDAFATYGPPHILTLVTEAATRALKTVRRQKFNYHRRARPEVLGGILSLAANNRGEVLGYEAESALKAMLEELKTSCLPDLIHAHNTRQNQLNEKDPQRNPTYCSVSKSTDFDWLRKNYLLPMAFPEGSPMHPAYGAGHATVAGACVTVLKAFFRMVKDDSWDALTLADIGIGNIWVPSDDGCQLIHDPANRQSSDLTLQGELNKLAANVAIGRNMAGVHYYTDYYDSLRMGERIAIGVLQEQMLTYPENITMRFNSFDNDQMTITTDGGGDLADVVITTAQGMPSNFSDWWNRHVPAPSTT